MKKTLAVLSSIIIFLTAAVSTAQSGRMRGVRDGGMNGQGMGMMDLLVAPDGTVVTVRSTAAVAPATEPTQDVVAITPNGSVAWTWRSNKAIQFTELEGNMVLVASGYGMQYSNGTTSASSELVALSLGTGAILWRLTLDGFAMDIEPAQTQIYAVVAKPPATGSTGTGSSTGGMGSGSMGNGGMGSGGMGPGGMMGGDRKLVAISNSGAILWSMPLTQ